MLLYSLNVPMYHGICLRREREAQELAGSVAVGAAGVEDGLRRIDDACGGNPAEKKAAVQALQQASNAINYFIMCMS